MSKKACHSELVSETNKGGERLPLACTSSLATPSSGGHPRNAPVDTPIEAPYELPEGWKWEKWGNVGRFISGNGFKEKFQGFTNYNIPFYKVGSLKFSDSTGFLFDRTNTINDKILKELKATLIPENSIIFAKIGEAIRLNRRSINSEKCCIDNNLMAFLSENCDYKYAFFWSKSIDLYNYTNATTVPAIRKSDLEEIPFPLPPTLTEQQRIVNRIETMFAKLDQAQEKAQTVLDSFETRKAAILHKAFTGELTANWRKENGVADDSWEEKCLGEISSKITDGEHSTPKRVDDFCGYYLLSARNIHNGEILLDDVDYVAKEEYERIRKRCNPEKRDILISCSGSVGRVCVIQDENKYVMVRSAAMVKLEKDNPFYVAYMLQSFNVQQQIERTKKQSCQANLFLGAIKELEIPVPSIAEQQEIVRILDTVLERESRAKEASQTVLDQIALLKKSILARAFRGEL